MGCLECRRRKKSCDQTRPACGRCIARGCACDYRGKQWTFIDQQSWSVTLQARKDQKHAAKENSSSTTPLPSDSMSPLGQKFQRTALEIGTQGEFLYQFPGQGTDATTRSWTQTLVELASDDQAASLAVQACAMMLRSHYSSDRTVRHHAFQRYAAALRGINIALRDLQTAQSDAILAACLAMANFERLRGSDTGKASSQGIDWLSHVKGSCRLVAIRGSARDLSRRGHTLFQECRTNAVTAAIMTRRPKLFRGVVGPVAAG